jgi:hypothetical protein
LIHDAALCINATGTRTRVYTFVSLAGLVGGTV